MTVPAAEETAGDVGEKLMAAEEGAVEQEPVPAEELPKDGAGAKAENEANQAAAQEEADKADLEAKWNIEDTTEKNSIIEPIAYENRYNYYLPYMRTTFYAQKEKK